MATVRGDSPPTSSQAQSTPARPAQVATDDRMIPPAAQRSMAKRVEATVAEAKGSHAIYVSQPQAVAELIEKAAKSLSTK